MEIIQRSGQFWGAIHQVVYHESRSEWIVRKGSQEIASGQDENQMRAFAQQLNKEQ